MGIGVPIHQKRRWRLGEFLPLQRMFVGRLRRWIRRADPYTRDERGGVRKSGSAGGGSLLGTLRNAGGPFQLMFLKFGSGSIRPRQIFRIWLVEVRSNFEDFTSNARALPPYRLLIAYLSTSNTRNVFNDLKVGRAHTSSYLSLILGVRRYCGMFRCFRHQGSLVF